MQTEVRDYPDMDVPLSIFEVDVLKGPNSVPYFIEKLQDIIDVEKTIIQ